MIYPPDVYIKETGTPRGRGVFAARSFAVGEVVEVCPVVLLQKPYKALHKELKALVFHWPVPEGAAPRQALALGYGSLYNHANPSNLRFETGGEALVLRLVAVAEVAPGEELTINYNSEGGAATSGEDWWFKEKDIELL